MWPLFVIRSPSPIRSKIRPRRQGRTKNGEDGHSNKVEGCPSSQKQRRRTRRNSVPVDARAAEPPARPSDAVDAGPDAAVNTPRDGAAAEILSQQCLVILTL